MIDFSDIKSSLESFTDFLSAGAIRFDGNNFGICLSTGNRTSIKRQRCRTVNDSCSQASFGQVKYHKLARFKDKLGCRKGTEIHKRVSKIAFIKRVGHCFFELDLDFNQ